MHVERPCAIGILGGTFNPPHRGHIALAKAAADQLGLDRVLLIPARISPHKPSFEDPGIEHRLAMCRIAAQGDSRIEVCALELERPGPSYTVDTLRRLDERERDRRMTLIMGADTAQTLPDWREPREILRLARLVIAQREGQGGEAAIGALGPLLGAAHPDLIEMRPVDTSSSGVRVRVSAGLPFEELVGSDVARYIAEHDLYKSDVRVG